MKTTSEIAREAGLRDCTCDGTKGCLERFAELIRADERSKMAEQPAQQQEPICKLFGTLPVYDRAAQQEQNRQIDQLIQERDHRDEIIDKLCDAVLGPDRYEWSSQYFFEDAVREVEERMAEQPAQQEQESWEDLHNALQRIDTAAVGLPTFEVRHEGGLDAVTQNIVDAITALHTQPAQQEPEFFTHSVERPYDWSEWVCPDPKSYLMKCCDCGLVHEAQFGVVRYKSETEREDCEPVDDPNLQAVFRMRRSEQWSPEDTAHRAGGLPMEQPAQQEPVAGKHQAFIDSLPSDMEDKMFEQIHYWARQSYARHQQSTRGQTITAADSSDNHIIWAALRWAKENAATPPAQRKPLTGEQKDVERYRWLRNPTSDVSLVLDKRTKWVPPDDAFPGVGGYWEYEYRAGEELDMEIDRAIEAKLKEKNT